MDRNRELAELLGLPWHEVNLTGIRPWKCLCNREFQWADHARIHLKEANPDFIHNPVLVIKEMRKREDYISFCLRIGGYFRIHPLPESVHMEYLTTDGLLCDEAKKFLKEVKG